MAEWMVVLSAGRMVGTWVDVTVAWRAVRLVVSTVVSMAEKTVDPTGTMTAGKMVYWRAA
jgi:hypothetical protein